MIVSNESSIGIYVGLLMLTLFIPNSLTRVSKKGVKKDHSEALLRRIDWFQSGDIERLIAEGREIQRRLKPKKSQQDISKTFSKLMMEGKIHSALRFLSEEHKGEYISYRRKFLKIYVSNTRRQPKSNGTACCLARYVISGTLDSILTNKKSLKLPS